MGYRIDKMAKHIHYIHLNTGNAQRLEPLSVDDTMVAMARAWLDQDGLHRDIIPGLRLDFLSTATGGSVFCTMKRGGETLAEFGIAKRSGGAAAMWADLFEGREGVKGDPEKPPQAPWLALYWLPAIGRQPREIAVATIAIAKACAWAWIEKRDP